MNRRKNVLIIVSSYRPAMLADMQRARMLAWELPKFRWDVEILTPDSTEVRQDAIEPDTSGFFAEDTVIHRVKSSGRGLFDAVGANSPTFRMLGPMRRSGSQLLAHSRFDIVYLSTTTFSFFSLGPLWERRFGVPYVLDFHDPWLKARDRSTRTTWKTRATQSLFRRWEKRAVTRAAGVIAVSPDYLRILKERYSSSGARWLDDNRHAVIPFAALLQDLNEARTSMAKVMRDPTQVSIRYVGAGGRTMARSFALICRALAQLRGMNHPILGRVRVQLFGTTYGWKAGDPKILQEIARQGGVGDLVEEHPERVSYRRSLELLLESDAALVLGVDDSGYMPSKLFTYALSGKPLLAALHRKSPGFSKFRELPSLGHALWFDDSDEMPVADARKIVAEFLEEAAARHKVDRTEALRPFLASAMAERHAEMFEIIVNR